MGEIFIITEGRSESNFLSKVIAPYLARKNIYITASILGKGPHKGGRVNKDRFLKDFSNALKQFHGNRYISTMFDYYKLDTDWFGMNQITLSCDCEDKVKLLENETKRYCVEKYTDFDVNTLFIPYISLHEFEALLFSDPENLAVHLKCDPTRIHNILDIYPSPEHINNSENTAPSKRIIDICPRYANEKVIMSHAIVTNISIDLVRSKCKHFNAWLEEIEQLDI